MAERALARRYARAFIDLAEETDDVESLGEHLNNAVTALRDHDDLLFNALCNPVFTLDERRRVLGDVLPRMGLHAMVENLLKLMLSKGRFELLPLVHAAYRDAADTKAGRARVRVDTAEPLTPQLEAEVRASLETVTGKTVILETRVDPALIGGMVARVGGKVYDASIKNRLESLKQALLSNAVAAEA